MKVSLESVPGRGVPSTKSLLELFWPARCLGCGRYGALLCRRCRRFIQSPSPPLCPYCGRPLAEGARCHHPPQSARPLAGIRSAYIYDGPMRLAIHALKFRGLMAAAEPLGDLLAAHLAANPLLTHADALVAVPLHPSRQAERGYNQAALLAERVAGYLDCKLLHGVVERVRPTAPQTEVEDTHARHANVAAAFRAYGKEVRGARLILIDDVCTTGATLESCGRALREAGAAEVWGLTLARQV